MLYVRDATVSKVPCSNANIDNVASPTTGQFSLSFPTLSAANAPIETIIDRI